MVMELSLGDLSLDVTFKDIKNVHLSVHPPEGRVTVSAPTSMNLDMVRVFAITKLGWIKRQQKKLRHQPRETVREYVGHESHYLWGKRYLLDIVTSDRARVTARHSRIELRVPAGWSAQQRRALISAWYRDQIKAALPSVIAEWAPKIGVVVDKAHVQQMKTKWGSCNPRARAIRINTELAKKPRKCFEYVVVHELAHLLEPTHNERFRTMMDRAMPDWRLRRSLLNELPLGHVTRSS